MPEARPAPPSPARRDTRTRPRRPSALVAAGILVAALLAGSVALHAGRAAARGEYDSAHARLTAEQSEATELLDGASAALDDARTTLEGSAGKVPAEAPRVALADAIEDASTRIRPVARELAESKTASSLEPHDGFFSPGVNLRGAAHRLAAFRLEPAGDLRGIADELADPVRAVAHAVAGWEAEQERILRERYTNNVHTAGWTAELDACLGSVDVTGRYGVPTIAEHWSCGGRDFPDEAGTIITLTGERAGTYRVEGIVAMLHQSRATTADLPTGYDLLYQTCQNGQPSSMSLTALTRLG